MVAEAKTIIIKVPTQEALDAIKVVFPATNFTIKDWGQFTDDNTAKTVSVEIRTELEEGKNTVTEYTFTYAQVINALVEQHEPAVAVDDIDRIEMAGDFSFLLVILNKT